MDFFTSLIQLIGFKDGKLVIGKIEIPFPAGFFYDATSDAELIEEILRMCFVRPRAMWEQSYRENREYVRASLQKQQKELDRFRREKFFASSGQRAQVYRELLGAWADRTDYFVKRLSDMDENSDYGGDRLYSDKDFHVELAKFRLKTFTFVEALLALLPAKNKVAVDARQKIQRAKDEAIHEFKLSTNEIENVFVFSNESFPDFRRSGRKMIGKKSRLAKPNKQSRSSKKLSDTKSSKKSTRR